MAKKKKNNKIPLPIFILICAVLVFAMYISLSTLVLAIWGESVMGTVDSYDSRREDMTAQENRSRTISKGYWFMVNGKEYRGYVIYSSDEAWPNLDESETRSERISYLSFLPYINKPSALCEFRSMGEAAIIYHILSPVGCLLLLLLVIRTQKKQTKQRKRAARKPAAPQIIETRSDTDMFCHNCGNKLPEGADFCISCGIAKGNGMTQPAPNGAAYAPPSAGLVGFSDYCNHPEILAAAKGNKKFSIGCMWILTLVPLIGFPIAGLLIDDLPFGEAVIIGVGIAIVMLIFNLIALSRTKKPMWEGVVVNKYSKEKSEHRGGEEDNHRTYTEYTTVINTDEGKKKTIVERDSGRHMYDYLSVGERVRFHPTFGTYEKYDKSKDRYIYCNVCSMMNPIQNDRCKRCNNLLFK